MKVLFIGPFRGNTGWAEASRDYIKALQTISNIDLSIRPIYMDPSQIDFLDFKLQQLEKKTYPNYDVVIQKVLPHYVSYNKKCGKHFLLCATELMDFQMSGWQSKLSIMDGILTPDSVGQRYLKKITKTPVYSVGEPLDVEKIVNDKEIYQFQDIDPNSFRFYTIGEYSDRKNLNLLIRAYLLEFNKFDNVHLIVKTYKSGENPEQTLQNILEYVRNCKNKFRKYINIDLYPPMQLIGQYIPNITSLHRACDCFVLPSRGEAFCRPAAEALVCGNPVITTNNIGTSDFVTEENGWLINSRKETVECKNPPMLDMYTSHENWMSPMIKYLRKYMRRAYENKIEYEEKSNNAKKTRNKFTYEYIGERIEKCLKLSDT